ncbi:hypothetical protein BDZ45DRAFT_710484 [Acephala macrosclerotiorum]|nr:hypothetical protein BDZ45DRAFT_710484 [Acephala macrosclerotiorum]
MSISTSKMAPSAQELPKTHRALVLSSTSEPPEIKEVPTQPGPGSVVVRMLSANILSYQKDIYIASSQEEMIRCLLFLLRIHEGHTDGGKKLMHGEWRDGSYAEYVKVLLECAYPLNENILMGKFGYGAQYLILFGGLSDINIRPGETIIVAPATGPFGMAAVKVALAMGTRVIAMGRNLSILQRLQSFHERVKIVQITGDEQADLKSLKGFGNIDAYFDISPPVAGNSTHFKSCILALRHSGRVSLMGGLNVDLAIPHTVVMHHDLLKGKWMYDRQNVLDLIKMVEIGLLKVGKKAGQEIVKYRMEKWRDAFDAAVSWSGASRSAVLVP